jgi:hypothetical protein
MRRILGLIALLALTTLHSGSSDAASSSGGLYQRYRGELQDDGARPLSGVFTMTFSFWQHPSGPAVWRETRIVAVVDGEYEVKLGSINPMPFQFQNSAGELHVMLESDELTHHAFRVSLMRADLDPEEPKLPVPVHLAEVAERAMLAAHADTADNCDRLGGKRLDEIDRFEELLAEVARMRALLDSAGGKPHVSSKQVGLPRIGGSTGNRYAVNCPPGSIVTGVEIKGGDLIDSITPTCTPIE